MNNDLDIVSGDFEGNFFTHQKAIISAFETTIDKNHQINLYRGELNTVKNELNFNLEEIINRDSLLLYNVSNIQLNFDENNGSSTSRIFSFDYLIIQKPLVKESWEINGKTYGIITGRLIGKIKTVKKNCIKETSSNLPNEQIKNTSEPLNSSQSIVTPTPKLTNTKTTTLNQNQFWDTIKTTSFNDINNINPGCLSFNEGCLPVKTGCLPLGNGCLNFNKGCFSIFWKLFLAILSILFIFWLLKSCLGNTTQNKNCRNENDSLTKLIEELRDSIDRDDLQYELDKLSSKIYFFGDSSGIRKINNEKINKIVELLNKNKKCDVLINGYMNNTINKKAENNYLDYERAKSVEKLLIEKGIDESRITSQGMGISKLYPSSVYDSVLIEGRYVKYNKNMRVELKIKK